VALETGDGAEEAARAEVVTAAGTDLAADARRRSWPGAQDLDDLLGRPLEATE
jgi:hypothetical protein